MILTGNKRTTAEEIVRGIYDLDELMSEAIHEGQVCFFCTERVWFPCIWWHGASGDVFLHPQCAVSLSMHFMSDVQTVERETGCEVVTTTRMKTRLAA